MMVNGAKSPGSVNFGDKNDSCGNITNSFNENNVTVKAANEREELLQWLSPLVPWRRHQDVRAKRIKGVGDWILETEAFKSWRSSEIGADEAVLFCYGDPGVGKTYINSLVIDGLRHQEESEGNITVAGVYCDFYEQHEQTSTSIMGAILKQLVAEDEKILESVRKAFQKAKDLAGSKGPCLPELVEMLKNATASLPQVFICIDALDECPTGHLSELLGSLKEIVQKLPSIRVFLTGRRPIEDRITKLFTKAVTISITLKPIDIQTYLEKKLESDTSPDEMSEDLLGDIKTFIRENISESLLLVSLSIDTILGGATKSERRKRLNEIKNGYRLDEVYEINIKRMKAQGGGREILGMKALMWVAYSERPLQTEELTHALGVEVGSAGLDYESVPEIRTLQQYTLGLITVEQSSSTVRLVHSTLQNYLSKHSTFERPHTIIAEICLTYLNFERFWKVPPSSPHPAGSTTPLVYYASCYWERHAREDTAHVKSLVLRLLDGFNQHVSSKILLRHLNHAGGGWQRFFDSGDQFAGFTSLHWAVSLGMLEITVALLEDKRGDLDVTDTTGKTPIAWAARRGHIDILELLLEQENTNPSTADNDGRTPLSLAAEHGHEELIKVLLKRKEVNPDEPDNNGRTPILWAVSNGHEEVVKVILKYKDDVFRLKTDNKMPVLPLYKWIRLPSSPLPKPGAPSSDTPLILQILFDWLIISVVLCLLAFLSWIIPSSSTILLSLHR